MDGQPASGQRVDRVLTVLCAVGLAGMAWALRSAELTHGYSPDEVGTLLPGGLRAQWADPETGVNPPLWRWGLHLMGDAPDPLAAGRGLAALASSAAVGVLVLVGRALGGRWWAGALVGLLLAVHPPSVAAGGTARVYGLASLGMALHLLALLRWVELPSRRRAGVAAATALVLPWLHYATVPWLAVLGVGVALTVPGRRKAVLLGIPAAVGAVPLAVRILASPERRELPRLTLGQVADATVALGLDSRRLPHLGEPVGWLPGGPSLPALVLLGVLAAVAWRARAAPGRVALWSAVGLPVGALAFGAATSVRPPFFALAAVGALPAVAVLADLPRRGWLRPVAPALVAAVLLVASWHARDRDRGADLRRDAAAEVARMLGEGAFEGGLTVAPRHYALPLAYARTGRFIGTLPKDGPCAGDPACVVVRGEPLRDRDALDGAGGWVASFAHPLPALEGCVRVASPPGALLARCPGAAPAD